MSFSPSEDSVDFNGLLNQVLPYKARPGREFRLYEAESRQAEGLEDEDKIGGWKRANGKGEKVWGYVFHVV